MDNKKRETLILKFPIFRKSPDGLIREIVFSSRHQGFKQGSALYSEGDECRGLGLFLSGEVRVFKRSESGREITLYEIFPGELCILNASSILSKKSYPAYAVASTNGEMLFLPENIFLKLVAHYEDFRSLVFSIFSRRLSSIIELIDEVAFGDLESRLIAFIIEKARNSRLNMTHHQIANELGTSREVVSRLLKDLERRNKFTLSRNSITLLSP